MSSTALFSAFSTQLRGFIRVSGGVCAGSESGLSLNSPEWDCRVPDEFDRLARELFALQYRANAPYRRWCESLGVTPQALTHWSEIPSVPTAAFKDLELSCLAEEGRTVMFRSSGTTQQRPSRHFHSPESLALYEASLLPWFVRHLLPERDPAASPGAERLELMILTPSRLEAPHSSLVHMFESVRRELGAPASAFFGAVDADDGWTLDGEALRDALATATKAGRPVAMLGTAFQFVHLLDHLRNQRIRLELPPGSRALETGGYKGRSRSLPKAELHEFITERLGISPTHIVCEYGMSELSSQAYDRVAGEKLSEIPGSSPNHASPITHHFRFPPWARAQVVSPETGREVGEGETGLIRVFDLANVVSVLAIQTEDLGTRRGEGFELLGRAALAETRGCSLMAV